MQTQIFINGTDFSPWIKEDGITIVPVFRNSREVATLGGLLFRSEVEKDRITIQLVEMRSQTLFVLLDTVTAISSLRYTTRTGQTVTRSCYARVNTVGVKRVVGGNTYYSGVEIELEEK